MIDLIEKTLRTLIPIAQEGLFACASYSLEGGKRLRPLLTLAVADTYKCPLEHALIPACTLELIHTYSLIHDDLPSMDDDDMRRGKPSLHKAYPEGLAVLTGDFLLTYAFEILSNAPHLTPSQRLSLIQTLSHRSGHEGMVGGQYLDLTQTSTPSLEMERKKTGALIMAALEFGGIVANVPDLSLLQRIGEHLGLAFQLIDDILDEDGIVLRLGKQRAEALAEKHFTHATEAIALLPSGGAPSLTALASAMVHRTS